MSLRPSGHPVVRCGRARPGGPPVRRRVEAVKGTADSGDPEQDLAELLREVGEAARATGTGALFLIDEMQNLDKDSLAATCLAFQGISKRGLPVAMVAAGLPDLRERLFGAKPYADRLFTHRELGSLSDAEARSALIGPAAQHDVAYSDAAVDAVLAATAGYPYFIQEYGRELWNHAETSPITSADVDAVGVIVGDSLARDFFGTRFGLATDAEQRYLAAMASLGQGPYRTREAAEAYGASDQRAVSIQRDSLIKKGLVWSPRRAFVDFTVPLFADYLRDHHELGSFD